MKVKLSLSQLVDQGLEPRSDGSEEQRDLATLKSLSFADVVNTSKAYEVQRSLRLIYRHLRHQSPLALMSTFLAVYVIARQCSERGAGLLDVERFVGGGSLSVSDYQAFLHTVNPLTGMSMGIVMRSLHLHPAFKDQGDDIFYSNGESWWHLQLQQKASLADSRAILLTALFFLCVRSERGLAYFMNSKSRLVGSFDGWCSFYSAVCLHATPFFGLSEKKSRSKHTTEQKTWSAGWVLDRVLQPLWQDPKKLDDLICAKTTKQFAAALSAISVFGGDLIFTHTLEYLALWDSGAEHPMFSVKLLKQNIAKHVKPGKNSLHFLRIASACGQRGTPSTYTMSQLADATLELLPRQIVMVDGTVKPCPHFFSQDASQNACKAIQVQQVLITGCDGGKARSDGAKAKLADLKRCSASDVRKKLKAKSTPTSASSSGKRTN